MVTHRLIMASVLLLACSGGDDDGAEVDGAASSTDAAQIDGAAAADAAFPDATAAICQSTPPCPTAPSGYALGDPMAAIDACAFAMQDDDTWTAKGALLDAIDDVATAVTVADVLGDLNRQGSTVASTDLSSGAEVTGVQWAFAWNSGDLNVAYWIPQGLTGSPDASDTGLIEGKRVAVATWYYNPANDPQSPGHKGVRISMADITKPSDVRYRLLLLVEPFNDNGRANLRHIPIHAGGVVWYGPYLYVADTSGGFRVFDTRRILRVATGSDTLGYSTADNAYYAYGYKYVVPQVGNYSRQSACSPRYSFVALDRSSQPPALISGEYNSSDPARRLFRWPLDPSTHRLPAGTFYPSEAFFLGYTHVQGAVVHDGTVYLSSSEPPSGRGSVVTTSPTAFSGAAPWVDGPEDLVYDVANDHLWGMGEHAPTRYVFAATPP